jgi:hypothetical protein
MIELEVKTRGGSLTDSQRDTYRKKQATTLKAIKWRGQTLRNFGVAVVRMSGTTPLDSEWIKWCRFDMSRDGFLVEKEVSLEQLVRLVRFDIHPDTLTEQPFRRHHKTNTTIANENCPLGFSVEKPIVTRS